MTRSRTTSLAITAGWLNSSVLLSLAVVLLSLTVLLLASFMQATWGKSPGKAIFQLRIADRHGLPLRKSILFSRMLVQLLPLWTGGLYQACQAVGATTLGQFLAGTAVAVTMTDGGFALFSSRTKSLHDLLFRTNVVLDSARQG